MSNVQQYPRDSKDDVLLIENELPPPYADTNTRQQGTQNEIPPVSVRQQMAQEIQVRQQVAQDLRVKNQRLQQLQVTTFSVEIFEN